MNTNNTQIGSAEESPLASTEGTPRVEFAPPTGRDLPAITEPWRSKKEVAAHYGMCTRTVDRAVAESNGMPHCRIRGRIMFQFSAIDRWLTTTRKYRVALRGGKHGPNPKPSVGPASGHSGQAHAPSNNGPPKTPS